MKITHDRRAPCGFTMLELLVVIAIIALLSVMSFSIYGAMINTAKKVKAYNQATAIAAACEEYFSDFKCYPPDTALYKPSDTAPKGINVSDMKYSVHRYLGMALIDKNTGKTGGPYLRDIDNSTLRGEETEIDGRLCKVYSDPWWKPGEDDKHAYEYYCKHITRDNTTRTVTISMPYDDSTPEDQRTLEVKAWSRGPDGKESATAPFFPTISADEDKDNIMSWTKGK